MSLLLDLLPLLDGEVRRHVSISDATLPFEATVEERRRHLLEFWMGATGSPVRMLEPGAATIASKATVAVGVVSSAGSALVASGAAAVAVEWRAATRLIVAQRSRRSLQDDEAEVALILGEPWSEEAVLLGGDE